MNIYYFIPKIISNHTKSYKVTRNPNDNPMVLSGKKKALRLQATGHNNFLIYNGIRMRQLFSLRSSIDISRLKF